MRRGTAIKHKVKSRRWRIVIGDVIMMELGNT